MRAKPWGADGVAPDHAGLPTKWTTAENVKWVADVPGWGWSSPIVWGNRVFLTEALEGLRRQGLLSVWTLRVGSDVGGYLMGFETGGVFYAWNMAHNPAYNSASPGKALWASAIQGCFDDGTLDEFNMMRGDTDYKLKWTGTSRELLDIRVRNLSTTRSALLNKLRRSAG